MQHCSGCGFAQVQWLSLLQYLAHLKGGKILRLFTWPNIRSLIMGTNVTFTIDNLTANDDHT